MRPVHCHPQLLDRDLSGKRYLITDGYHGVGFALAKQLLSQGAHVLISHGHQADHHSCKQSLTKSFGDACDVSFVVLDLDDLDLLNPQAKELIGQLGTLDGLINHAELVRVPFQLTDQGFESHLAVNYLAHLLLCHRLIENLLDSDDPRVLWLSNAYHDRPYKQASESCFMDYQDLHFQQKPYDANLAYSQSMLAKVLVAKALAAQFEDRLTTCSTHVGKLFQPFGVKASRSGINHRTAHALKLYLDARGYVSSQVASETLLHCLLDDNVPRHSGEYFSSAMGCDGHAPIERRGGWPRLSPNPYVYQDGAVDDCWRESTNLLKDYWD